MNGKAVVLGALAALLAAGVGLLFVVQGPSPAPGPTPGAPAVGCNIQGAAGGIGPAVHTGERKHGQKRNEAQ